VIRARVLDITHFHSFNYRDFLRPRWHTPIQTQRYVRMYDLGAQKLLKTFIPGIKWISSLDIHPSGDHFIVGGYDRKLCWFDLELSDKPYKVLR
jgi:ribosome biogenesis protein ERB1